MTELACFPFGVNQSAEGVCLLIKMGPYRILLDGGVSDIVPIKAALHRPFAPDWEPTGDQAAHRDRKMPADLVLCSHAHPDHARGLLALHRAFPRMPIYASEATTQLLPLNWLEEDPQQIPFFCQALPWRSPVEFRDGLSAELFPAGHLPGAAAFLLTYTTAQRTYSVFYTGDFFSSNSRLVERMRIEELRGLEPDVLIIEGSYGTARHPNRRTQENQLAERISNALINRYTILLPVPTLGLGQELLMLLRSHHQFTGRDLDIWVDGAVGAGCDAYLELLPHLPVTVQNFAQHQPLFWDERVRPRVRRLSPENQAAVSQSPCIILSDRNVSWDRYLNSDSSKLLVLLPHSPGGVAAFEPVTSNSGHVRVETYLLSEHCDGLGTMQLIHNLRPQHVIFIHGSPDYLGDLTGLDELHTRYHLHTPANGTLVELPVGETFVQPAPPETSYEGELTELESTVVITLPEAITGDRRWQNFADTGLISARWQGEELVLRGVPQRELLNTSGASRVPSEIDCCGTCRYYRGQRCRNSASPLFDFKVTPDGYCPVFERAVGSLGSE